MKPGIKTLMAILFVVAGKVAAAQELWTIGPMLHVNFGGEKRTTSFSIEAAYWNLKSFYYSVDFAIEFDRKKVRLYSEAQTGIGLTGISIGPVVEFGNGVHLGVQASCWVNYFLGVDYRLRLIDHKKFHAVGVYGKLPVATSGLDSDGDGVDWGDAGDWD